MPNPILTSDLVQDDGAIKKVISQLEDLVKEYGKSIDDIKAKAKELDETLKKSSPTNPKHREKIKKTATEADKLAKAQARLQSAYSETGQQIATYKKLLSEQNKINKLNIQLAQSATGSYNKLSAQYSLNKIALNKMSDEQRKNTKSGQDLERQTKEIYDEMKRLQEATGKHTLSVGDYTKSIREATKKQGELSKEVVRLKDEFDQLPKSIKESKKAKTEYIKKIKSLTDEMDNLSSVTGKAAKDFDLSSSMTKTARASNKAKSGVFSLGKAFKALLANPVVLVLSLIVGALSALFGAFKKSKKGADLMTKATGVFNAIMGELVNISVQVFEAIESAFNDPLGAIKNMGKALLDNILNRFKGILELGGVIGTMFSKLFDGDFSGAGEELANIKKELIQIGTGIDNEQQEKIGEAIENTTKRVKKSAKAHIKLAQAQRNLGANTAALQVAIEKLRGEEELLQQQADNDTISLEKQGEAAKKAMLVREQRLKKEIALARMQSNIVSQEIRLRRANGEDVLALQEQKSQALTEIIAKENELKQAIQGNAIQRKMIARDLFEVELDYAIDFYDSQKTLNERKINDEKLSFAERQKILQQTKELDKSAFSEQIALVEKFTGQKLNLDQLALESDEKKVRAKLLEKDLDEKTLVRILEILRERKAANQDILEAEQDLNDKIAKAQVEAKKQAKELEKQKYDSALETFDQKAELAQAEFELLKSTEADKTKFALEAEKARLQEIIKLNQLHGKQLSKIQLKTLKKQIEGINQKLNEVKTPENDGKDIFDSLGFNLGDEQKEGIKTAFDFAKNQLLEFSNLRKQIADQRVQESNNELQAAQNALQIELEKNEQGLQSDVDTAKERLENAKSNQKKALNEQRKAQREQQRIAAIQQAVNLITASSKIFAQIGNPLIAIPMIGLMWGAFLAAKLRASKLTKKKYGKGDTILIGNGSHASGNDTPLGIQVDGQPAYAEQGEAMAVIAKKRVKQYGFGTISNIIDQINKGTLFNQSSQIAQAAFGLPSINVYQEKTDNKETNQLLKKLVQQNQKQVYKDSKGRMVESYRNITTTYLD